MNLLYVKDLNSLTALCNTELYFLGLEFVRKKFFEIVRLLPSRVGSQEGKELREWLRLKHLVSSVKGIRSIIT